MESNLTSAAKENSGSKGHEGNVNNETVESNVTPAAKENSGSKGHEGNVNNETKESMRRRGRPLGSKNKPKPVVYRDSDNEVMPHVIEIEDRADVAQCLHRFYNSLPVARFDVMSATGLVADVTISTPGSIRNIPGISQILSLSGSYIPQCNSLSISLLDPQNNVLAGKVEGILRAAGRVVIVAGSCKNPDLIRPIIPPSGVQGDGNEGCPGPSYSQGQ